MAAYDRRKKRPLFWNSESQIPFTLDQKCLLIICNVSQLELKHVENIHIYIFNYIFPHLWETGGRKLSCNLLLIYLYHIYVYDQDNSADIKSKQQNYVVSCI